jgi:hypothetical protein
MDNVAGLQVLDISDPAAPLLISENSEVSAYDLAIADSTMYAANAQGLQAFDLSNPTAPLLVGTAGGIGPAYLLALSGDYAYLVTTDSALQIVDIQNHSSLIAKGSCSVTGIKDIAVSGDFAYAVNGNEFLTFDVSDPAAPRVLASRVAHGAATGIDVRGACAYVADFGRFDGDTFSGVWIYDISDPGQPYMIEGYRTPGRPRDLLISGRNLFVADYYGLVSLSVNLGTGDVNADAKVSAADIVWLVNYLYKDGPDPLPNLYEGDVNCDGTVDLIDLIYLGNHIFRAGPAPC